MKKYFLKNSIFVAIIAALPSVSALSQDIGNVQKIDTIFLTHILIEGDILVPKASYGLKACYITNLWTNGIVPYNFDANVQQWQQNLMVQAMAEWEAVANVDFVPRNGERSYIHIFDTDENISEVGMTGGMQEVGIFNWGHKFIMAHELGHTLGFWHEQSRSDRGTYIQVNVDCIDMSPDKIQDNFGIHNDASHYGSYDFTSVMHYHDSAFYKPTLPNCTEPYSITVLPPYQAYQNIIGQRDSLSYMDKLTMSLLYPEDGWKFASYSTETFSGGIGQFTLPWLSNSIYYIVLNRIKAGEVLWIEPGNYLGAGVYNKPVTLRAPLGNVIIMN